MNKPEQAIKWLQAAADDGFPCYPLFESDPYLTQRGFALRDINDKAEGTMEVLQGLIMIESFGQSASLPLRSPSIRDDGCLRFVLQVNSSITTFSPRQSTEVAFYRFVFHEAALAANQVMNFDSFPKFPLQF